MSQTEKALNFNELHKKGAPVILYNVWDAGSAKALTDAGAKAIATGSWSMAAAHGYEDGAAIPLEMVLTIVERIACTVDVPVTVDFEGGYAARALGVSIDVLKGLIADGLLLPDYQFNDRMRGFSRETLDRFLAEWCTGTRAKRGRGAKIALLELARSRCVRTSRLLLAVRALGVPLLRDARRHGLAGVFVAEADTVALLRLVREQVGA